MNLQRLARLIALAVPCLLLLTPLTRRTAGTTTYKTYAAYKATVDASSFIASDRNNPRLLTDAQFAGQVAPRTTLLGIYYGNQGWQMGQVQDMERWQGKQYAIVNFITNWCNRTNDIDNLFNIQLINIWNNHNVPMITWEPFLCSPGQTPANVEVRAAQGAYDAYLTMWADRLKLFLSGADGVYNTGDDRRAYLRMGHEMNGDWIPWGAAMGKNAPADFVAMWKRVKAMADGKGLDATHLQWVWCVNDTDNGGFVAERYYPGDAYVDWVAIDGYNWGESQSWSNWTLPGGLYDTMIHRLRAFTAKPLAIPEYATTTSTSGGADVAAKARWITTVHQYVLAKDVRMVVWFNQDKETDWAVFGGSHGDGTYVPPSRFFGIQPWQIVGAVLLTVFVMAVGLSLRRLVVR